MCGHSLSQDTVGPSASSYWSDSSTAVIRLELLETSSAEAILLFPSSLVGLAIRDVTCSGNGIQFPDVMVSMEMVVGIFRLDLHLQKQ